MTTRSPAEGVLIASVYVLGWEFLRAWIKAHHFEQAYWGERRGRARVEKEMKKLTEIQLNTTEGFFVQPIAYVESCYRQCIGTPRQGALVPSSRASIILTANMSPESLDGLEEFSHVWLTFKFHLNTNTLKEAKAFSGTVHDSRRYTFTAKITPPMLKEKKGVLATRSPHRPNPVGVTLARLDAVDKRTRRIRVSACDLVNGTPILDIKPYVPAYDTVQPYAVPSWIEETIETRNTVTVRAEAAEQVMKIAKSLREYKNAPEQFIRGMTETLAADVRSKFQTKRRISDSRSGMKVEVPFDEAIVRFLWLDERELEVVEVVLASTLNPLELGHIIVDEANRETSLPLENESLEEKILEDGVEES